MMESMPKPVLEVVITHVGEYNWSGSMFTDDSLASKKIYPGYLHRHSKAGRVAGRGVLPFLCGTSIHKQKVSPYQEGASKER